MAKLFTHVVKVQGSGAFPVDMLRYDRLTPSTERDSSYITETFSPRSGTQSPVIELKCEAVKEWAPTTGRWQSFWWRVISHERRQF